MISYVSLDVAYLSLVISLCVCCPAHPHAADDGCDVAPLTGGQISDTRPATESDGLDLVVERLRMARTKVDSVRYGIMGTRTEFLSTIGRTEIQFSSVVTRAGEEFHATTQWLP